MASFLEDDEVKSNLPCLAFFCDGEILANGNPYKYLKMFFRFSPLQLAHPRYDHQRELRWLMGSMFIS